MKGILIFELFIIAYTLGLWYFMRRKGHRNVTRKFLILIAGVLLFEMMSEPMWINRGFDTWAYIYRDITWIGTLGWASIFMSAILLVDRGMGHVHESKKFWVYLLMVEAIVVPIEAGLIISGARTYAPVLTSTMSGIMIPFTPVPIEAVFAVPLFGALILTFYKYVNHVFEAR